MNPNSSNFWIASRTTSSFMLSVSDMTSGEVSAVTSPDGETSRTDHQKRCKNPTASFRDHRIAVWNRISLEWRSKFVWDSIQAILFSCCPQIFLDRTNTDSAILRPYVWARNTTCCLSESVFRYFSNPCASSDTVLMASSNKSSRHSQLWCGPLHLNICLVVWSSLKYESPYSEGWVGRVDWHTCPTPIIRGSPSPSRVQRRRLFNGDGHNLQKCFSFVNIFCSTVNHESS